jgi:membrane protein required for colicin V production
MNFLDIIILFFLGWGFIMGLKKGFIIEVASLIALILGIWAGIHFSDFVSGLLISKFGWSSAYLPVISFLIIFIVIVIAVFILAKMIEKFVNLLALGLVNKLAGAVFGTIKFAIILSVAILIMNKFDTDKHLEKKANGSLLYNPVASIVPMIIPKLNVIKDEIKDMTKKPVEKENNK